MDPLGIATSMNGTLMDAGYEDQKKVGKEEDNYQSVEQQMETTGNQSMHTYGGWEQNGFQDSPASNLCQSPMPVSNQGLIRLRVGFLDLTFLLPNMTGNSVGR